ncbi:R3H domain-containing nucleic acid-binding protein [Pigmentibacter sp. JX0631]|uniref:R3H domain-containing nucleic acid-binding protein n=1 Tax=Pigmentibacter sp. JX0631 TaxID=2976982 RepID=UPI0024692268|nr:R3H domain-containing nucleic acid-binding protein [Pigmentibacter sp. JX0631]WGL60725.1 R3H domain-containing nucleic acid-binding protein [Pigmentibacter sp. JX0631]
MTELSKFSINPDTFIFAVNQAFEARLKNNGDFNSHLRFDPFLTKSWTAPKNPDFNTFKNLLNEIISHHFHILPNFHRNENVDIENISWFSHSVATLFADLNYLILQFTGQTLPNFSGQSIPKAVSSKNIALAMAKYSQFLALEQSEEPYSLFPLVNENNENVDQLYTQEVWSLISSFSKKTFGNYFPLLQAYILWKYTKKEYIPEVIDWNVRPPCGAAYELQFKELFEREHEERKARRIERQKAKHEKDNSSDRKKHSREPSQQEKSHFSEKTNQHEQQQSRPKSFEPKQKFELKNFQEAKENRQQFDKSSKENKHSSFNGGFKNSFQTDSKQNINLDDALAEAKQAIQNLIKNKNINEVSLAPQNSFVRREQHSLITEAGFETESRGEAKNRHVCIKRKS